MSENPPFKRRYNDACATAHAMELLGERWALLVVRELMTGPKRFSDIKANLPGISANVLTQRLEGLEAAGILNRRKLPPPAASQVYELTDWGYESEPIFQAMGRWAARSPHHDPTLAFSTASLMLSLRTMFEPAKARGVTGSIGFHVGYEVLHAQVANGRFQIEPRDTTDADVIVTGAAESVAALIYGDEPLEELESAGQLTVAGDRKFLARFITLFPLPDKVAATGPMGG